VEKIAKGIVLRKSSIVRRVTGGSLRTEFFNHPVPCLARHASPETKSREKNLVAKMERYQLNTNRGVTRRVLKKNRDIVQSVSGEGKRKKRKID